MARLTQNSYGKCAVRLTKVARGGERHELMEMAVDIRLHGDFSGSYTDGDNSQIVATDSMKNTVYVLGKENDFGSIEEFAILLARHFAGTYRQVKQAEVEISQTGWARVGEHPHAFVGSGNERRVCSASAGEGTLVVSGGVSGLRFLKTAGSEFGGFVSDRYRTLKDAKDRIFATSVEATWVFGEEHGDFNGTFAAARKVMLATMAEHHSLAVQQTLFAMGEAVLAACPGVVKISLELPNLHRIVADLKPFGLENSNEIFVPVEEPFGIITGVVERK